MEKKDKPMEEDEDDLLYFQTLLRYLENVAPEQKLTFREECLRLVKSFAFPTNEEKKKKENSSDNNRIPDWRLFAAPMLPRIKLESGTYERGLEEHQRYGYYDVPRYSTHNQLPACSEMPACRLQQRNEAHQARGSGFVKADPDFVPYMDPWPERHDMQPRSQERHERNMQPRSQELRSSLNYMSNVNRANGKDIKPEVNLIPSPGLLNPEGYARNHANQMPPRVYPSQADAKKKALASAEFHQEHLDLPSRAGPSGSNRVQVTSQAMGFTNDAPIKPDPERVSNYWNMGIDIENIDISDDEDL